ncbi:MAG: hypothetical protein MUF73_03065 [Rhodobacteraceae bacterium]|jgi:hypothetical protein|nr:hypothetical protein [Paracoccaceae bacterium]
MRQAVLLFLAVAVSFQGGAWVLGTSAMQDVAQGATALVALILAATFLWLWARRTTPLALGMALSWAGAGLMLGWWWAYGLMGRPEAMATSPVLLHFLALYAVGSALHLAVIARSFDLPERGMVLPMLVAAAAAWVASLGF